MANVAVTNTTGLYGLTSSTPILNSAQQLLTLLDNNGNVAFSLDPATGNTTVEANFVGSFPTYSNSNVAAYLPGYNGNIGTQVITTSGGIFWSNGQPYSSGGSSGVSQIIAGTNVTISPTAGTGVVTINATGGTTYSNSNVASYLAANTDPTISNLNANTSQQQTQINAVTAAEAALSANVGSFYTYSNSTYATQTALSGFETYANATYATQSNTAGIYNHLQTLDANVGSFYTYANSTYLTSSTGVSQIIAGANITISPPSGQGIVTISASGGGGGGSTGTTGYYLNAYDTTTQSAANSTTAYVVKIGNITSASGITVTNGNAVSFTNAGVYQLNLSLQLVNSDNTLHNANIWLRQNGVDVPYSNSNETLQARVSAGIPSGAVVTIPYIVNAAAGDTAQFVWQTDGAGVVQILTESAGSTPTRPAVPGVILTAENISNIVGNILLVGDVTGTGVTGTNLTTTLAASGVTAGVYGDATHIPQITIDSKGRATSAGNIAITIPASYGNSNVAAYLPTYTGNIGGWLNSGVNSGDGYVVGDGVSSVGIIGSSNNGFFTNWATEPTGDSGPSVTIAGTNGPLTMWEGSGANIGLVRVAGNLNVGIVGSTNGNVNVRDAIYMNTGIYWSGNGQPYATGSGSTYGNANVAAYLPTYSGSLGGTLTTATQNNITSVGTLTGLTVNGTSTIGLTSTSGVNLTGPAVTLVGTADVSINSSSQIYLNSPNVTANALIIGANLTATGNLTTVNGVFWTGNGQPYSTPFNGNLAGNFLRDTTLERIIAIASPQSIAQSWYGSGFDSFVSTTPTYSSGVLQPTGAPGGNNAPIGSGQTITMINGANVALASSSQTTNNRITAGVSDVITVYPASATMTARDRVRGSVGEADVIIQGQTWGTMTSSDSNQTMIIGQQGIASGMGFGNIGHIVGQNGSTYISVNTNDTIKVQYATGQFTSFNYSGTGTGFNANVVNFRGLAPVVSGVNGTTLAMLNSIGLHTQSGWANNATNKYVILNEDSTSLLKTNANIVLTSGSSAGVVFQDGTFQSTAYTGGAGVSQIIAGTNVTISPTGGTGAVTINATSGSSGGLSWQTVQTANLTATSGSAYPVNTTSGNIWVTLPSSPSAGNVVSITDYAGTFSTHGVIIAGNGANIDGQAQSVTINNSRETIALVYIDSTQGWIPYSGFNTSTPFVPPTGYSARYLMVAGGAGGGWDFAGGGGAGGLLTGNLSLTTGTTYSFTVGAGGTGASSFTGGAGGSGSNTTGLSLTAVGGGGGGDGSANGPQNGVSGGSGGGGGGNYTTGGVSETGGSGTSGQGNAGGTGGNDGSTGASDVFAGGGGGAGATGTNGAHLQGGAGGSGSSSNITGTATYYAGGGGGSGYITGGVAVGAGGQGGGGVGGYSSSTVAGAGSANTGGGGGGGAGGIQSPGGNGGSGVVIISVPTANYTGTTTGSPTVTTSGSNTIMVFTTSGSYTA